MRAKAPGSSAKGKGNDQTTALPEARRPRIRQKLGSVPGAVCPSEDFPHAASFVFRHLTGCLAKLGAHLWIRAGADGVAQLE